MKESRSAIAYASIAILSWSTVATAFKIALRSFSHYEMLLIASFTALALFAVVMTLQSKWRLLKQLSSKQWLYFSLIGLLNPLAYYLVLFKAYDLLPAQVAQPINYSWPILLLILLSFSARQHIPRLKYMGMVCSLLGVAIISFGTGGFDNNSLPVSGLLLAFLSALLWAVFWIVNNRNREADAVVSLFVSFLFGTFYLLMGTMFVDVYLDSRSGLLSSVYIGLFEMGFPFILWGLALRKTDNPVLINQICYLSPFISLFIIHIVLREEIRFTTYVGLSMIVFGIIFNEYLVPFLLRKNRDLK